MNNDLMTVKEAAAYLRTSPQTIRAMCKDGKLQASRLGTGTTSRLRISTASIENWLETNGIRMKESAL